MFRIISDAALTPLPVKSVSTCPRPPGLHRIGGERQILYEMYLKQVRILQVCERNQNRQKIESDHSMLQLINPRQNSIITREVHKSVLCQLWNLTCGTIQDLSAPMELLDSRIASRKVSRKCDPPLCSLYTAQKIGIIKSTASITVLNLHATLTCNMSAISLFRSSSKSSSRGNVQTLSPHFSPARIISDENSFLFVNAPMYRFDKLLMQVPVIEKYEQGDVRLQDQSLEQRHGSTSLPWLELRQIKIDWMETCKSCKINQQSR